MIFQQPSFISVNGLETIRITVYTYINVTNIIKDMVVDIMDYISTSQAAKKWGITERRVQKLCIDGRIDGAVRFSYVWAIPKDAPKPADPRKKKLNLC